MLREIASLAMPYQASPLPLLARLRALGRPVLLHSADADHPAARFDIVSAAPRAWVESRGGQTVVYTAAGPQLQTDDPFTALDYLLAELPARPATEVPFCGGLIGMLGYDLARQLEPWNSRRPPAEAFPDLLAGRYEWAVITDHDTRTTALVELEPGAAPAHVRRLLEQWTPNDGLHAPKPAQLPALGCEISHADYNLAFRRVQDYIQAGDCYQVNLSVRFSGPCQSDPLALYTRLVQAHPAPFCGFLETPEGAVLSFSPERFLRVQDGIAETWPIKGTRPRGQTPEQDAALRAALLASGKDRAENLMIVDLLRNDLGRSCTPGSIQVPALCEVQSFGSVHHLVSRVQGRLRPDTDALQALRHCFPGGSITGAPKRRAMQIIDELEPHFRGPYCGSLFMVDASGRLDSSITIRTLLQHRNRLYCCGGGGLVADSDPDEEWAEIHHKVGALTGARLA